VPPIGNAVRRRSYRVAMAIGILIFAAVFLVGLAVGTSTRRPLATASIVFGAFVAIVVGQTHEPFQAFAAFALIALVGIVVDSVRETLALLVHR
jgi:hypothetical protein